MSESVTALINGGFRDAVDTRSEFEGVVVPVWGGSSAVSVTVSGHKCTDATGFRGDVSYWGHFKLPGAAAKWKPFVPLSV